MATEQEEDEIEVTPSSGNVFADLGLPEPEAELHKARLAVCIWEEIKRLRLNQSQAAARMGITQPKVSAIMNGRLANFSSDRLIHLLNALDQDIEITVKRKPRTRDRARIRVMRPTRITRATKVAKTRATKISATKRTAARTAQRKNRLTRRRAGKAETISATRRSTG